MIQAAGWVGRNVCYPMLGGALVYLFLSFFALGTTPLHLAARFNWPKARCWRLLERLCIRREQ